MLIGSRWRGNASTMSIYSRSHRLPVCRQVAPQSLRNRVSVCRFAARNCRLWVLQLHVTTVDTMQTLPTIRSPCSSSSATESIISNSSRLATGGAGVGVGAGEGVGPRDNRYLGGGVRGADAWGRCRQTARPLTGGDCPPSQESPVCALADATTRPR